MVEMNFGSSVITVMATCFLKISGHVGHENVWHSWNMLKKKKTKKKQTRNRDKNKPEMRPIEENLNQI